MSDRFLGNISAHLTMTDTDKSKRVRLAKQLISKGTSPAGLPDFSRNNLTTRGKIYQMARKYIKWH
jgi:hypothetical protein